MTTTRTMREVFAHTMSAVLDRDPRIALVLADISADGFAEVAEFLVERPFEQLELAAARRPHGLDVAGIGAQVRRFLGSGSTGAPGGAVVDGR